MQLKFSGKQDVYLEIAERYKEYIRLGVVKAGEKLPSVREVAGNLGVNPNTVARAYSKLEQDGYLRILPKKGVYVMDPKESASDLTQQQMEILQSFKAAGVSKASLLKWIEEVYGSND